MATFIELLLTGGFGLAAGLGGVALQSYLHRKDRIDARDERRRELKREKAEQAFEALNDLIAIYGAQTIYAMRLLGDDKPDIPPDPPSSSRLQALLAIYFPGCSAHLEKFDEDARAIYADAAKKVEAVAKKNAGGKAITAEHLVMAYALQQRSLRLADQLRPALKAEVDKLW